jgi:hypothetical protein
MTYDNTNSGMLAANERKAKDTHPTHTGFINVEGREYWVSAWVNTGKEGGKMAGKKFFSLKLKPKDEQPQKQGEGERKMWPASAPGTAADNVKRNPAPSEDFDDDIPFAFAIAVPALALILSAIHHAGGLIA